VIGCRMWRVIVVLFGVRRFTMFMRFEHDVHVRIKKENEIRGQSHHAA
jgi:hypothetical protein